MTRLILPTALFFALSGGLAFAQNQAPEPPPNQAAPAHHQHPHNPQKEAEHLSQRLNLTPDQTSKLEPILADRDQKLEAIRSNTSLTQQDAWAQVRAVQKSTHDQLATVLTPEQMQAMHPHHGRRGGNGTQPTNPPPPSA